MKRLLWAIATNTAVNETTRNNVGQFWQQLENADNEAAAEVITMCRLEKAYKQSEKKLVISIRGMQDMEETIMGAVVTMSTEARRLTGTAPQEALEREVQTLIEKRR